MFLLGDLLLELIGVLGVVVDGELLVFGHLLDLEVALTLLFPQLLEFIHIGKLLANLVSEALVGQVAEV